MTVSRRCNNCVCVTNSYTSIRCTYGFLNFLIYDCQYLYDSGRPTPLLSITDLYIETCSETVTCSQPRGLEKGSEHEEMAFEIPRLNDLQTYTLSSIAGKDINYKTPGI